MKLLLTGATGFLGSHLTYGLLNSGHDIVILKRKTSDTWRIKDILNKIRVYDIDDIDNIDNIFEYEGKFDAVIHTATLYGRNAESDVEILKTNVLFSLKLLETASFYNTDSSLSKWIDAYALTKQQFVEWGKYYASLNKINFINIKLEHMYGERDSVTKFVPWLIKQCLDNVLEIPLTAGEQRRDFIHVDDVVRAYMVLLEKCPRGFNSYDVGTGECITIRELAELLVNLTESKSKLNFGALKYRKNEIMESITDIVPLKKLGWLPMVNREEGLSKIVEFMKLSKYKNNM